MVPFISMEIARIMKSVMRLFIKTIMEKVSTPYEVQQLDVD